VGSDQASRAKAVIERQTNQLSRLVDDLLDVTRISRGKVRLRRSRVVIHVTDDGIGIAPDMLGHVLQPFTQADNSLHRGQGGLGLGLALFVGQMARIVWRRPTTPEPCHGHVTKERWPVDAAA
jgi:signal transduction histidine kinase